MDLLELADRLETYMRVNWPTIPPKGKQIVREAVEALRSRHASLQGEG